MIHVAEGPKLILQSFQCGLVFGASRRARWSSDSRPLNARRVRPTLNRCHDGVLLTEAVEVTIPESVWQQQVLAGTSDVTARLAIALCRSAISTGGFLADGTRFGIKPGEESVTDQILIQLSREVPELRINKVARHDEVDVGADWEWWIEGQEKWFGFLVQAKRVHRRSSGRWAYNLGYRPAPKEGQERPLQVEALIGSAEALNLPAMYALYNEAGLSLQYHRPQLGNRCLVPNGAEGITALSAWTADWILRRSFSPPRYVEVDEVAPFAFPLSCLAYCLTDERHGAWPALDDDLPGQLGFDRSSEVDPALSAARFVLQIERSRRPNMFSTALDVDRAADIERLSAAVRTEPPRYVPVEMGVPLADSVVLPVVEHPLSEEGTGPRFVATLALPPYLRELKARGAQG